MSKPDLEHLLSKLKTDEGKSRAMIAAIRSGLVNDNDFYERTVKLSFQIGILYPLLKLASEKRDDATLIEVFKGLGFNADGIKFTHKKGYFDREIEFLERQEGFVYRRMDHILQAHAAEKNGRFIEAGGYYEMDGQFLQAGLVYEQGKDFESAIRCFGIATVPGAMARCQEEIGDLPAAMINYEKHGHFGYASRVARRLGYNDMAEVYNNLEIMLHPPRFVVIFRKLKNRKPVK